MDPEPRWLTPDERAAWLAAATLIVRLPAALSAQLEADSGLSFFEYMVMAMLSERPDRSLQMSDLAHQTSASLSRLSHTASRLERQGFLVRARGAGRGRRTIATLTDAGFAQVVAAAPQHVARARELLIDQVTEEDLGALRRIGATVLRRIDPADAWVETFDPLP